MLVIREDKKPYKVWHVNEGTPDIHGPVIDFQADGHELDLILIALGMVYTYNGKLLPLCPKCSSPKLTCINGCTWEI